VVDEDAGVGGWIPLVRDVAVGVAGTTAVIKVEEAVIPEIRAEGTVVVGEAVVAAVVVAAVVVGVVRQEVDGEVHRQTCS
jgi:hypothetical protein